MKQSVLPHVEEGQLVKNGGTTYIKVPTDWLESKGAKNGDKLALCVTSTQIIITTLEDGKRIEQSWAKELNKKISEGGVMKNG